MAFESFNDKSLNLHPRKRVHYSLGLVLGVDEFRQDELSHLERVRRHHRSLHGYGIVSGLAVSADDSDERRITVKPGLAIDVAGRDLCVPREQCGSLLNWVRQQELATGPQQAFVVLCYEECLTDEVPVLAGPCLSHDQRTVASRVLERFRLEFRAPNETPEHAEDPAMKRLTSLIAGVTLVDEGAEVDSEEDLRVAVRSLAEEPGSEVTLPAPFRATVDTVRSTIGIWLREVRPQVVYPGGPCEPHVPETDSKRDEPCVVLAGLSFSVASTGSALVIDSPVAVEQDTVATLLPTQLLQALHWTGPRGSAAAERQPERSLLMPAMMGRTGEPVPQLDTATGSLRFAPATGATPMAVVFCPPPGVPGAVSSIAVRFAWRTLDSLSPGDVAWELAVTVQAAGEGLPGEPEVLNAPAASGGAGELVVTRTEPLRIADSAAVLQLTLTPRFSEANLHLYYVEVIHVYDETGGGS